ncbi:MAG: hypothetical protein ACKPKO_16750, partial [Candidatus Fonsibacter sp.]
ERAVPRVVAVVHIKDQYSQRSSNFGQASGPTQGAPPSVDDARRIRRSYMQHTSQQQPQLQSYACLG